MKKISISLIIIAIIALTGCNNENKHSDIYTPNKLDTSGIVSKETYLGILQVDSETEYEDKKDDTQVNYDNIYSASEIQLENQDNSTEYIIDGDNIVYNGITFLNLNSIISDLESPYSKNNLINFIIKTYITDEDTVYIMYNNDNIISNDVGEDVGASITVHESLQSLKGYDTICNKYNDIACWTMSLLTENTGDTGYLHGCKSFIIYQGSENQIIDMAMYDTEEVQEIEATEIVEETLELEEEPLELEEEPVVEAHELDEETSTEYAED